MSDSFRFLGRTSKIEFFPVYVYEITYKQKWDLKPKKAGSPA